MKIEKLIKLKHGLGKANSYSGSSQDNGSISSTPRESYRSRTRISHLDLGPKRESIEDEWSSSQDIVHCPNLRKKSNDTLVTVTGYYLPNTVSSRDTIPNKR
jgi:hypothetical protein